MKPKVSIIIAVYNCEKYIETCARSLFEQTLEDIEYIFVNDATPDNSLSILKKTIRDYSNRKPFIKIIDLKENCGVSNVREIGMEYATGEYVIHTDSDDWVDLDMYERLYHKAVEKDADIVGCNFRHEFSNTQYDFRQQYADNMDENISRLINGDIFPSLCTSLTRRSIIVNNGIKFPAGLNMGEDLFYNLQLYLHANKIVSIAWTPYHYRHTEESSCVKRTRKSVYSDITIAGLIEKLLKEKHLYEKYKRDVEYRKFISKLPLIQDLNDKESYKEWLSIYPETNKHIWIYKKLSRKQRVELWLAYNKLFPIAKAFHHLLRWQHIIKHNWFTNITSLF